MRLTLVTALCVVLACSSAERKAERAGHDAPPLFDGCAEFRKGNLCELDHDSELVVWVPQSEGSPSVLIDGKLRESIVKQARQGTQVRVSVPVDTRHLEIRVGHKNLILRIVRRRTYPELEEARRLQAAGLVKEASAKLATLAAAAEPELKARALSEQARLDMGRGRHLEAINTLRVSRRAAIAAGLHMAAVKEQFALASTQMQHLFQLTDAERTLASIEPVSAAQVGWLSYHQAALALLGGNPRVAVSHIRTAAERAEQLGIASMEAMAGDLELMVLAELGRLDDARALAPRLLRLASRDDCGRARIAANVGWIELTTQAGDAQRAHESSREALVLFSSTCPDLFQHQNALVNLALASFKIGALEESKRHLADASALGPLAGWVKAWAAELEGRLALAAGDAKTALTVFRDLQSRAEIAAPVSSRYRAAVGVGLALKQLGDAKAAVEAFLEAESQLDQDARLVPVAEGRDVFVGEREESSRELVDTLLKLERFDDALRVTRRARARALRTLNLSAQAEALAGQARTHWLEVAGRYKAARKKLEESEQAAWEVPLAEREAFAQRQLQERQAVERALDETYSLLAASNPRPLLPPAQGELVLAFHSLPQGFALFAATADKVHAHRITDPLALSDSVALSAQLLGPFAEQIARATWIKVLPYGPLKNVAFHALPFGGSTLLDHKSVVYGADLGEIPTLADFGTEVAVVADPRADLSGARQEGKLVASRLQVLAKDQWFGLRATRETVSAALSSTRLVHFAGHAQAEPRGVHSRMLLAAEGELDVGDILMLPSVPHTVVLSGCETTREMGESPVASLGLAQAFLARGSQLVIATTAPVSDAFGLPLMKQLYAEGGALPDREGFRKALLSVRRAGDDSWLHYRALVP